MERNKRLTTQYICVPQYDQKFSPLEVCGEMLHASPKQMTKYNGDDIDDVLDRLNNYNLKKLEYYVCAVCSCKSAILSGDSRVKREQTDEEDSEDEGIGVEEIMNILQKHQYKPPSCHGNKALLRLITSFRGKGVTEDQLNQIQDLLASEKSSLQEVTLMFLHQLCLYEETAIKISRHSIMEEIFNILSSPNDVSVQVAAFKTVEKLFTYNSIIDSLWNQVDTCILPCILRIYYTSSPLAVKYSATCLLRTLSINKSTADLLGQESLLILKQFKDSSARLKEIFTEILINLYRHQGLVDKNLLDTNLLPTCFDSISEGPCSSQTIALSLLASLLEDEKHILVTINHKYLIPSLLNCLQLSDCRKVREAASCVLKHVTRSEQPKIAHDFMTQIGIYFQTDCDDTVINSHQMYPVLLKHQTEEKLWSSMDQFIHLIVMAISKEAELTNFEGMDGLMTCNLTLNQVGCLTHLSQVLSNLCVWPIEKHKSSLPKIEVNDFSEDHEIKSMLSKMNHFLTLDVWHRAGTNMMIILRKFSRKLQTCLDFSPTRETIQTTTPDLLIEKENEIVQNILRLLAFISVATCQNFKLSNNDSMKANKPSAKTQIWVDSNPHLTSSIDRVSEVIDPEIALKDKQTIEAVREGKLIRQHLYEQNLYEVLSPFLESKDTRISVFSPLILRCFIQPLDDIFDTDKVITQPPSNKPKRSRPQSAITRSNSHKIELTLHGMSPQLSSSMRKILRPRPVSACNRNKTDQKTTLKPPVDGNKPLTQQCRQSAVRTCGPRLLKGIFSKSRDVKKSCLLLIQDLVKYGTVETHMELSQLGCIPKLIDFLRINEDDEMLEISGLILTKMLISSDFRLKQLFNRHGGSSVLMAMAQYAKGKLRDEVRLTLQEVTRGDDKAIRPVSAPSSRPKAPDVWDHIMGRWKREDQVVHVLRKWLKEDEEKKLFHY
ncbi:hypothetical protein SNE40_018605 [Patella caerulea]